MSETVRTACENAGATYVAQTFNALHCKLADIRALFLPGTFLQM